MREGNASGAEPGQAAKAGKWTRCDAAYGCWLIAGIAGLWISVFSVLPLRLETYQVVGMVLGVPLVVAGGMALFCALLLSVIHWRHPPLLGLAGSFVVLLVFLATVDSQGWSVDHLVDLVAILYAIASLAVSTWWFGRGRRAASLPPP